MSDEFDRNVRLDALAKRLTTLPPLIGVVGLGLAIANPMLAAMLAAVLLGWTQLVGL